MFWNKKNTNMELEIFEQTKIVPTILNNYINQENGEININLPNLFIFPLEFFSILTTYLFT